MNDLDLSVPPAAGIARQPGGEPDDARLPGPAALVAVVAVLMLLEVALMIASVVILHG